MQDYGIAHVWGQGDFVTRAIAIVLLIMSVLSWTVIIVKAWQGARIKRLTSHGEKAFWHSDNFDEGMAKLNDGNPNNPLVMLALAGKEAVDHHQQNQQQLHDAMNTSDWVARCLKSTQEEIVTRLQSGLAVLASIGSTAPFVGLFGTVWGIYHALVAIGTSGQTSIDRVAGPVGEALIMTAFGLFVAIPAVLGYNALTRMNKSTAAKLNRFVHGLHAYFVTGTRLRSSSQRSGLRLARAR
ncbi:MotA/TolQ/ExbB proton channel family protein [Chitinasiproducens palmae]|uniref:Biopolymer transport protein ExbB n=1 Tax=Chitinasiproducens palmae TaxID=1770053 RepID=A0A1H2PQJ9_9BURK|nr:MotA/TolQ/ExbB proton channel family protein [Chitinasiproducens palmae]SDV49034.1 outer membrane transport energization protein ExbB [Chitinasiproducens palmae]